MSTSALGKHNCVRTCARRPSQKSGQAPLFLHDGADGTPAGQDTSSPRLSHRRSEPLLSLPAHLWSRQSCQCQLAERFDAKGAGLGRWLVLSLSAQRQRRRLETQASRSNLAAMRTQWRFKRERGCDDKSQSRSPSWLLAIKCGLSTVSTLRCAMTDHFGV